MYSKKKDYVTSHHVISNNLFGFLQLTVVKHCKNEYALSNQ